MTKTDLTEIGSDSDIELAEHTHDIESSAGDAASRGSRVFRLRTRRHRNDGPPRRTTVSPPAQPDTASEEAGSESAEIKSSSSRRGIRILAFWIVPIAALLMALGVAYLKYQVGSAKTDVHAAAESIQSAKDGTVAILSYTPDTAEATLTAAGDRLTGAFRDSYMSLTHDVVIPGAKQRSITVTATVASAASVSATENHAVVLVFVNQAITMGTDAPSSTASVVEVTLDRVGGRWLISGFDPK